MRNATRLLLLTLALAAGCDAADTPPPPAPGPLEARAAALADEVGRILGERFDRLPAVEVRPVEDLWNHVVPTLSLGGSPPGEAPGSAELVFVGTGQGCFAFVGADRIVVPQEVAGGATDALDRALAHALTVSWLARRLRWPGSVEARSLPERWARQAVAQSLVEVAKRRIREARAEPAPEPIGGVVPDDELRQLGPVFGRSIRSLREEGAATRDAADAFAAATIDRLGLAGACRELARRPPSTYRELLHPEEYLGGATPADPAAEIVTRIPAILEGGFEILDAPPVLPGTLAARLGRGEAPEGFAGGVKLAGTGATILLLLGETADASHAIRDGLVAAERAASEEWGWLSTEESRVDGGILFRRRGGGDRIGVYGTEETVILARDRLVLYLRLSSPEDFVTDAAGLGRRMLARALDEAVPDPEPWELRWREFGRAARYAEALADPDLRIRRRAAARRDAMADPKRTPWAAFHRAAGDPDPVLREKLLEALALRADRGKDPAAEVSEIVLRGLEADDPGIRVAAARTIEYSDWTKAPVVAAVTRALADSVERIRKEARTSIVSGALYGGSKVPDPAWAPGLIEMLDDEEKDDLFRADAAATLATMPKATPEIRAALEKHADDDDDDVRQAVADAKKTLGIP